MKNGVVNPVFVGFLHFAFGDLKGHSWSMAVHDDSLGEGSSRYVV